MRANCRWCGRPMGPKGCPHCDTGGLHVDFAGVIYALQEES